MRDLEEQIARVRNAEVRPLVREAYRCYTAGAARAAIVLTWTAVCADLIDKARVLQERGEAQAGDLIRDVDAAQGKLDADSVRTMQRVENSLLDKAVDLELIDVTQRLQLERLKDDRNLCAHPSLRPLGELFEPPLGARGGQQVLRPSPGSPRPRSAPHAGTSGRPRCVLGDLDVFWAGLDEPMRSQLDAIVRDIGTTHAGLEPWQTPTLEEAESAALSLAALFDVRTTLPSIEKAFTGMTAQRRAAVIAHRPSAYFAAHLAQLMEDVDSFDEGKLIAHTAVLPCAPYLTLEQLQAVLRAWLDNGQCWGRAMPGYAVNLYHATAHLGPARDPLWSTFLQELAEIAPIHSTISAGIGPLNEQP